MASAGWDEASAVVNNNYTYAFHTTIKSENALALESIQIKQESPDDVVQNSENEPKLTDWAEVNVKEEPEVDQKPTLPVEHWTEVNVKEEKEPNEEPCSEKNTEKTANKKYYICDHCPYTTTWKGNLTKHMVSRHTALEKINWFSCEQCPYKGKTKEYLKWHMINVHNESVKWYECLHCPFKAKLKGFLERHVIVNHTESEKINWFQCDQCSYKGKFRSNLKQHILSKHTESSDINWFKCEYCPFKAKRKRNLRFHQINKHTEHDKIKWVQCEFCQMKFKLRNMLRNHIQAVHTEEGAKKNSKTRTKEIPVFIDQCSFKCDQCDFETADKETYKKHVLKTHTVTEIKEEDEGFVKKIFKTKDVVVMVNDMPCVKKVIDHGLGM